MQPRLLKRVLFFFHVISLVLSVYLGPSGQMLIQFSEHLGTLPPQIVQARRDAPFSPGG